MRIAITGGTGFLGREVIKKLLDGGHTVVALSRGKHIPGVELVNGDLTDKGSLKSLVEGADVVIHIGAMLGKWGVEWEEYLKVNFEPTVSLVELCKASDSFNHFIFVSTAGVHGRETTEKGIPPYGPVTMYERSKARSDKHIAAEIENGFNATILRPSHIMGPGDMNTLPLVKILNKLQIMPVIGGGKNLISPVDVEDVAKVIHALVESKGATKARIYIIANPESITMKRFLRELAVGSKGSFRSVNLPRVFANLMASVFERLGRNGEGPPLLTHSKVDFLTRSHAYDVSTLMRDLNTCMMAPEKTIQRTIDWYKQNDLI